MRTLFAALLCALAACAPLDPYRSGALRLARAFGVRPESVVCALVERGEREVLRCTVTDFDRLVTVEYPAGCPEEERWQDRTESTSPATSPSCF